MSGVDQVVVVDLRLLGQSKIQSVLQLIVRAGATSHHGPVAPSDNEHLQDPSGHHRFAHNRLTAGTAGRNAHDLRICGLLSTLRIQDSRKPPICLPDFEKSS